MRPVRQRSSRRALVLGLLLLSSLQIDKLAASAEGGCAGVPAGSAGTWSGSAISDMSTFENAYSEVECQRQSASKAGAEWLETEALLKRSRQQAEEQEWQEAEKLLQAARLQAVTAIAQAAYEAEAWKRRVVGNR